MTKKQKRYAEYKSRPLGWYHLVTDKTVWLFRTQEDFVSGMNTIALCALLFPVRIVRFELMGNHIHIVLHATGASCLKVFYYIRKRLGVDLDFNLVTIHDEEQLANTLLYVDRNPYETDLNVLPGGYPWGTGGLGFRLQVPVGVRADALSKAYLRRILHSYVDVPADYQVDTAITFIQIPIALNVAKNRWIYLCEILKLVDNERKRAVFRQLQHIPENVGKIVGLSQDWHTEFFLNFTYIIAAKQRLSLFADKKIQHRFVAAMQRKFRLADASAPHQHSHPRLGFALPKHFQQCLLLLVPVVKLHNQKIVMVITVMAITFRQRYKE